MEQEHRNLLMMLNLELGGGPRKGQVTLECLVLLLLLLMQQLGRPGGGWGLNCC